MYDGVHGKGQISLCMILKNEEHCLERSIASAKDIMQEIIVVDTGSTDRSKEIAAKYGAKIFDYRWEDDFAAARNFSLQQATKEWVLVLDADEALAKRDLCKLLQVIDGGQYDGAYFYQRNYFEDASAENWCVNQTDYEEAKGFAGYADVLALRFFKNTPGIFYEGVVHESVEESMRHMRLRYLEVPIHHFRQDSYRDVSTEKKEKYLALLQKAHRENPYSVKTCFLLGRQYFELDKFPEAIAYLEQAVSMGTRSEMVFDNLAAAYYQCGMHKDVIGALEKVLEFNPRYAEAYSTIALSYYEVGEVTKAINSLVKGINLKPTAVRYHFNLAAIYYREHHFEAAEAELADAIRLTPKFTRSIYLMFHVKTQLQKIEEAVEMARLLKKLDPDLYTNIQEAVASLETASTET